MRIFDAHTHLSRTSYPRAKGFYQLAVATTPEDCAWLETISKHDSQLFFACGIHPWYSADVSVEALLPWFFSCSAIGEIGMDSVWCQVDLEVQRRAFRTQLQLAEDHKKPIVLHTKGCEREVLEEISCISQNILVHWYSSNHYLSEYIQKGCYFSVGPDLLQNQAVQAVVESVPIDKLVLESDGTDGISWALGREVREAEIPCFLQQQIINIANRKGSKPNILADTLFENALAFLGVSR